MRGTYFLDGFVSRRTTLINTSTSYLQDPPVLAETQPQPYGGGKGLAAPALMGAILNLSADQWVGTSISCTHPFRYADVPHRT